MSKMNELSMILDDMITAGNNMVKASEALKAYYSSTEEDTAKPEKKESAPKAKEPPKANKEYSKEDVRALLSAKASESDGKYKATVKDLVKKYADGGTLKDVDPSQYAALVAELEVVANG